MTTRRKLATASLSALVLATELTYGLFLFPSFVPVLEGFFSQHFARDGSSSLLLPSALCIVAVVLAWRSLAIDLATFFVGHSAPRKGIKAFSREVSGHTR